MKMSLPSGLPVLAVFICALLVFAAPGSLWAEPADPAAASETSDPATVTPGTPAFQGLMPPAGGAVTMPVPSTAAATEVKGEAVPAPSAATPTTVATDAAIPTATVRYGAVRPDGEDTHPTLNLSQDKIELVRLESDAGTVIVGNPSNFNVQLENRRLLILSPHQAGATYLSILDDKGNILMQRHVVVGTANENYVRIRRSCSGKPGCQATTVYYCPGVCHTVGVTNSGSSGTNAAPAGPVYVPRSSSYSTSTPTAQPTAPMQDAAPDDNGE